MSTTPSSHKARRSGAKKSRARSITKLFGGVLAWLVTLLFVPFFIALGIYALLQLPHPPIPPTFYALLPAGTANQLEEEAEALREKFRQAEAELKRAEEDKKALEAQRKKAREEAELSNSNRYAAGSAFAMPQEGAGLEYIHKVHARDSARGQWHDVLMQRRSIYSKARIEWQKELAAVSLKRCGIAAAFVAACLLLSIVLFRWGRGSRAAWPLLRSVALAAPVVSLLAIVPWLPLGHSIWEHPYLQPIMSHSMHHLANVHTLLLTGYWPW